jgi:hypothetical protein
MKEWTAADLVPEPPLSRTEPARAARTTVHVQHDGSPVVHGLTSLNWIVVVATTGLLGLLLLAVALQSVSPPRPQ